MSKVIIPKLYKINGKEDLYLVSNFENSTSIVKGEWIKEIFDRQTNPRVRIQFSLLLSDNILYLRNPNDISERIAQILDHLDILENLGNSLTKIVKIWIPGRMSTTCYKYHLPTIPTSHYGVESRYINNNDDLQEEIRNLYAELEQISF